MIKATAVFGEQTKMMTATRFKFEEMGFHAFAKGFKNAEDDPEFAVAILAESQEFVMTPEDDWNQGWLIAFYKNKEKNDKNDT
jgi:hypothetical protein